jgi:hypothetical protein
LESVASIDGNAASLILDLMDGDTIHLAINLVMNMDDLIVACVKKVIIMIKKVTEGFANLPDVLREGIPKNAGRSDDNPQAMDVEADVEELDHCVGEPSMMPIIAAWCRPVLMPFRESSERLAFVGI